jgi:hypothetical protein
MKKRRKGGAPLGVARRDGFKQGAPKSRTSQKNTKNISSQNLPPAPVPEVYQKSPLPLTKLPSSTSSKKSSSGSLKLPTKKKNKGKQKINVFGSLLNSADKALAEQRNKGMKVLNKMGVVATGK